MIGDDDHYEIKCHPITEMLTLIVTDDLPSNFDCGFHDGPELLSQKGKVPGSMPGLPQPRLQVVLIVCPYGLNLLIVGDAVRPDGLLIVHTVERAHGTVVHGFARWVSLKENGCCMVVHGFARCGFTQREWPLHGRAQFCTMWFLSKRMAVAQSCTVLHDVVSHLLVHGRIAVQSEYDTIRMIQVVSCDDLMGQLWQGISHGPCCSLVERASCIDEKGQCFQKREKKKKRKKKKKQSPAKFK